MNQQQHRFILPFALIGLCLFLTPVCGQQQSQDDPQQKKSPEEMYDAARRGFMAGNYQSAFLMSEELCRRQPNEVGYQYLKGEVAFATGQMTDSVAAFDEVIRLQPLLEPRLWQRGLALYYAKQFQKGVEQFETHQTVNSQDVENAVWHLLCAAQISDVEKARKTLIPIKGDTRIPMSQIYEMFAGRMSKADVMKAANKTTPVVQSGSTRHNLQLYYAHLYVGLYEEMMGETEASLASMKQAVKVNPLEKNNFMGRVAPVHLRLRSEKQKEKQK